MKHKFSMQINKILNKNSKTISEYVNLLLQKLLKVYILKSDLY